MKTLQDKSELYVKVPEGIRLQPCAYGYGLFATRPFKRGEVVYQNHYYIIDNVKQEFLLRTDQGDFVLNSITHAVGIGKGKRALYSFDSMMNHSCDPNTFFRTSPEMNALNQYEQIACKDIHIGDQLTCDYDLLEYDCEEEAITCSCGSVNCRKEIKGFKWLPLEQQIYLLPQAAEIILENYS